MGKYILLYNNTIDRHEKCYGMQLKNRKNFIIIGKIAKKR